MRVAHEFEGALARVSEGSVLARAIRYARALCHRTGLGLVLEDGPVDLNTFERTIRPILLGANFAGSDGVDESWAVTSSLIQTVKLNSVEPFAYLRDMLERIISGHPKPTR